MCMNTQGCIQEDRTRPMPRPKSTRQRSQGPANRQNEGESCKEDHTANLKEKLETNKNNISMAHINIYGLLHKMAKIKNFLFTTKVDILAITETHLDLSIDREHMEIEGYDLERRDRQKSDYDKVSELWGAVVIYYKENLKVISQLDRYGTNIEAIWIEIISHSQRLLIGAVYRHPKDVKFFDKFRNTLEKIWMKRKHLVILGDLNSDLNLKGKNKGVIIC